MLVQLMAEVEKRLDRKLLEEELDMAARIAKRGVPLEDGVALMMDAILEPPPARSEETVAYIDLGREEMIRLTGEPPEQKPCANCGQPRHPGRCAQ